MADPDEAATNEAFDAAYVAFREENGHLSAFDDIADGFESGFYSGWAAAKVDKGAGL